MSKLHITLSLALASALGSLGCHEVDLDYTPNEEIVLLDDLYSISVVDRDHAVSVGYYGTAYYTSDGGDSWKRGITDTLASLYSVSMADAKHGWAVGQRGLILRTEDGGASWQVQPNLKQNEGTHLFAVTAIDAQTAWAIGEWGTRIRTDDGGKSWEDRSFTVDTFHPMFQWLSPFEQEKVRNGETVYEDVGLNDVFCLGAPSQKCWLIGEFGYIFYSDDAGETWLRSNIEGSREVEPIQLGYNEIEFGEEEAAGLAEFAKAIMDDGHLNVAIEAVATKEEIAEFGKQEDPEELFEILEARSVEVRIVLEDAGLPSERVRMRGQPPWDYADYLDDDPEFLQRYLDSRLHATPGVRVRVIQNPILFSVRFRDNDHGLISGLGGVVLTSDDGGESWSYSKLDQKMAVFSVGSVVGRALAIGEKGLIRVSVDEGSSWGDLAEDTFPVIYTYLRDIGFEPTGQIGFIVGHTGQILRSADAGYKWTQVLPAEDESEEGPT